MVPEGTDTDVDIGRRQPYREHHGNTPSWWPLIGSERARAVAVRVGSYLALWRTPLARVPDGFVKCRGPSPQREWELSGSRIQKLAPNWPPNADQARR
ncbi:hypothetical protein GCM10010349_50050 [Streptomyces flavofungini]|nr:hypothetical protein GCM10010349_50050 [Streptomyces flavofungini]